MNRRTFFTNLMALASSLPFASSAMAQDGETTSALKSKVRTGPPEPFSRDALLEQIRQLAKTDYVQPAKVPKEWLDLTYDQYRGLQFRHTAALWRDSDNPFNVEFLPPGLYFPTPIRVSVVSEGMARPVVFDRSVFDDRDNLVPDLPIEDTLGYSGFRLLSDIEGSGNKSEFAVFQGASYFRAIGKGQSYGLSARGLALGTGEPEGEEFPEFRAFWLEAPASESETIIVHALLDSPSVAGLYTFTLKPGEATEMDVEAHLFPRTDLAHVGIGAETSMFLFDATNRNRFDDFRPAVHDSDGLMIVNGADETLWRHLANPVSLQTSSFVDENPKGFGLMQRARNLADFADLEADYHKRPGLWVVPGEDWGRGAITLVEIPADREIYDNIVAYWRPREPLLAASEHRFTYRLIWGANPAATSNPNTGLARVADSSMGKRQAGGRLAVIEFAAVQNLPKDLSKISVHVSSGGGTVSKGVLQSNPQTGGLRLAFTFDPASLSSMELRAQLMVGGHNASEVWLYRWTK